MNVDQQMIGRVPAAVPDVARSIFTEVGISFTGHTAYLLTEVE